MFIIRYLLYTNLFGVETYWWLVGNESDYHPYIILYMPLFPTNLQQVKVGDFLLMDEHALLSWSVLGLACTTPRDMGGGSPKSGGFMGVTVYNGIYRV